MEGEYSTKISALWLGIIMVIICGTLLFAVFGHVEPPINVETPDNKVQYHLLSMPDSIPEEVLLVAPDQGLSARIDSLEKYVIEINNRLNKHDRIFRNLAAERFREQGIRPKVYQDSRIR